jgi:hypothetical protein
MGWYLAGAAAGVAASRWLRDKRARQEAEQQLEIAANAVTASPMTPALPVESWFTAPGKFTFGLPAHFAPYPTFKSPGARPVLVLADPANRSTYIAVFDRHLNVGFDGHSVWLAAVNPDGFRNAVRSWGGNVVQGPIAVLVCGERGIWSVVDTLEHGGEHIRRWSVMTAHAGKEYEVIMGADLRDQAAAVDVLATAIGSWRWADSPAQALPESVTTPQVRAIVPQLELESWFEFPGEFRFALPRNFAEPSPEMRRAWEGRNGPSLLCIEDANASDVAMFLMVQRNEAIAGVLSSLLQLKATEFREVAWQRRGMRITSGPEAILVAGEHGMRFDVSQVDGGIDTRQCVAQAVHHGKGYEITMFVKADAQPRYESALLTVLGSWIWISS